VNRSIVRWAFLTAALMACAPALADPWLAPGDERMRSDILLLADANILRGPVTTWPLSWPDIARDVLGADGARLDDATAAALLRVQREARFNAASGFGGAGLRAAASHEPAKMRGFADDPREEGELALRAGWLWDHLSLNLQGTVVADPDDGRRFRPDGTYLGVNVGNFMVSAGFAERWWGPGWDGSLILSTNARPIPSVTLERNYTDPFRSPLLSWIGPWRASIAVGKAEEHGVDVPGVRFLAARVNFRPRSWLEFGLTRTAQWCGGNRECGWNTFTDMLLGRDNQLDGASTDDQPGNQMAGYDMRLRSPWRRLPVAFYTQWVGEDEAGGLPSKFLGLFGVESWHSTGVGALRLRGEYADTTCVFTQQPAETNCAYRNQIYPQGYAYRGRIIGHSMDNDSRMSSFGLLLTRPDGDTVSFTIKHVELNRDGGGSHAISEAPAKFDNVELRYAREMGPGKATVALGRENDDSRGFLLWQQGF
jgi:hypothetical protein